MKNRYYLRIKNNYIVYFCVSLKYTEAIVLYDNPLSNTSAIQMYESIPIGVDRRGLIGINPSIYITLRKIAKKIATKVIYLANKGKADLIAFSFTDNSGEQCNATITHRQKNKLYFTLEVTKSEHCYLFVRKRESKMLNECYETTKKLHYSTVKNFSQFYR